ncbi:MAG: hypothetical protein JNL72_09715 [Flavipsychrobacter sp.]|nr:hypothetical protein [Flavipsychrobacter sp.]
MRQFSFGIALLALFLLNACSSCKKEPVNHVIEERIRQHFNFQTGSYWIYKDSMTGIEDSFVVESNYSFQKQAIFNSDETQDIINIVIREYRNNSISPDSFVLTCTMRRNYMAEIFDFEATGAYSVGYGPLFIYPFTPGGLPVGLVLDNNGDGSIVNIYPSYTINNTSYTNVALVNHSFGSSSKAHNDYFYISPDVGIIKMNITRTNGLHKVWELQRKNIIL